MNQQLRGLRRRRSAVALLASAVLAGIVTTSVVVAATGAGASATPPWEPLGSPEVGSLLFYNSAGEQITGGSTLTAPFAAYAEGTSTLVSGDSKATLEIYTPVTGVSPGAWNGEPLGGSPTYPNSGAPAPLNTATLPVYTGTADDTTLQTYATNIYPNKATSSSSYYELYAIRLVTSDPTTSTTYDATDIAIDTTTDTWTVVYPAPAISTATVLTATPSSPQAYGTTVKLTATVTPAVAGTVQFEEGSTDIGSPVAVTSGKASYSTTALPEGSYTLHAVFTPTSSDYTGSTGSLPFQVTAASTSTVLTTSPAVSQYVGSPVELIATITPAAAAGTVQFKEGSTDVGTPVTVSSGRATDTTSTLPQGTDALTADFTASSPDYKDSTGDSTIDIKPVTTTTTTLSATPVSPQFAGTAVTLTATVTPSAATGKVQFKVGATDIGSPVAVSGGKATIATSTLPAGADVLSAVFTPTSGNGYGSSTGTATFTVVPLATTTTSLGTSPASPQLSGVTVTLSATVTPSAASGSVQFEVGSTDIGGPVTVAGGKASTTTAALPVGTDDLAAVFTPTPGNGYGGSTGTAQYVVTRPKPALTGYDLVGADGGVFVFNPTGVTGGFYGSLPGDHIVPNAPVVGIVPTLDDQGYFLVGSDGGLFSFGNAPFLGSLPSIHVTPAAPIVGIVATDTDAGYYLVGADGGVFAFGHAPFLGSLPQLGIATRAVVGIAATPSGNGYWVVLATGTVYAFGAAKTFHTTPTTSAVTAIAGTPTGGGFWLVTKLGGVYAYGNAAKKGSGTLPSLKVVPNLPVIGIVPTAGTTGYWLIGLDGGIYAFGTAPYYGSLPGDSVKVDDIAGAVPN